MRDEWETQPLGAVCEIVDNRRRPITKRDRVLGPYPYFGATGVVDHVDDYLFDEPLVLVGEDGAKWGAGERSAFEISGRTWVNNHAHVLRPARNLVLDRWLVHWLNHSDLRRFVTGLTVPKLNQANLRLISIPVPPLAEQERIVCILDEALERLSKARSVAETNLTDSGELWQSKLQEAFARSTEGVQEMQSTDSCHLPVQAPPTRLAGSTRTGGRAATTRRIDGEYSLAVGPSSRMPRPGWQWTKLDSLARLESGHTPSRKHPEYWSGKIPWIGIEDARAAHGRFIEGTAQHVSEEGVANSSTRLLPSGTVCLSRTASVGYVVIMASEMCTSQDFVNWVCAPSLDPEFLMYLFLAEGRKGLLRFASGSVHQTIYFPEVKAFHICHPDIAEQERIVSNLRSFRTEVERLQALQRNRVAALDQLRASMRHQAFSGQL